MMNVLLGLESSVVQDIGWTLVQFLWQGTLIAIVYAVARAWWGRSASPRTRYRMASATLAIMAAAPVATFLLRPRFAAAPITSWPLASPDAWTPVMPWVVAAWTAGVLLFSIRLVGGWSATFQLRRDRVRPAPPEWQQRLMELMQRVKVSRPVELLISPLVDTPAVVGWWRPAILIPVGALTGMAPNYLEALLVHELAHVRRLDFLGNMLQGVAEAVLFYHPGVWWVSEHIRAERESICDDIAVAACGDVLTYARALSELESCRPQPQPLLAANGGPLLARIRRLMGRSSLTSPLFPSVGTIAAIAILWLAGVGSVVAQDPWVPTPPAPEPPPLLALNGNSAISTLLFSPQGPAPRPDKTAPETATLIAPSASGRVEGRVIDSNGQPVRNATVELLLSRPPADNRDARFATPLFDYSTKTNTGGAFALQDVDAGTYRLNVSRQGYLTQTQGAATPGNQQGTPIAVGPGQTLNTPTITLTKQGIIAGRVLDGSEPVQGVEVRALRVVFVSGRRQMQVASKAVSDDIGEFRVTSLTPGRYYLFTDPPKAGGAAAGTLRFPTYAPNSLTVADASILDVAAGSEVKADIRIRRDRMYKVSGVLVGISGGGARGNVRAESDPQASNAPNARTNFQGEFEFRLGPGTYTLRGIGPSRTEVEIDRLNGSQINAGDPANEGGFAALQITVSGSDIEGLRLPLHAPGKLHGAIQLEGGSLDEFPRSQDGQGIIASVLPRLVSTARNSGDLGEIDAKGNFTIPNVPPGSYLLNWTSTVADYYVKSVQIEGVEMKGKAWTFEGGDAKFDITLAKGKGTITGVASGDNALAAPGAIAALWPKIPDLLMSGGGLRTATADSSGTFAFPGVAPGEYYVAAFAPLTGAGVLQNRQFLDSFHTEGVSVTVSPEAIVSTNPIQIPAEKAAAAAEKLP